MTRRILLLAVLAGLSGCVAGPADRPAGNFPQSVSRATGDYVRELARLSDEMAEGIEDGSIVSNADAFTRFQDSSRSARERWNAEIGAAFDVRLPPDGPCDATAWREFSAGLRQSLR